MTAAALRGEVASLLREAAVWRVAGLLLERPREGFADDLEALAAECGDPGLAVGVTEARDADEGAYLAVLGPGGPVSPREAAYGGWEDPARILSSLRAYYDAFSFAPRAEDPPDHAAVEWGFVGYMFMKEAFLRDNGETDAAETVAAARRDFLEKHVRRFAAPLERRLAAIDAPGHLRAAARAAAARAGEAGEPLPVILEDEDEPLPGCPGTPEA